LVHIHSYNEGVKKNTKVGKRGHIMSQKLENAIVTIVGAAFLSLSGWGVLALANAIYSFIN